MTLNATQDERQPDGDAARGGDRSCRGSPAGCLILEYGDHECPYSRQAFRAIQQVEQQLGGNVRFAFRHFPLTGIHPHALAAAAAAEAARQGRFWDIHELLFHRQNELGESDLVRYTAQLGLDAAAFDTDRTSVAVLERIRRVVASGRRRWRGWLGPVWRGFIQTLRNQGPWRPSTQASGSPESARRQASWGIVDPGLSLDYVTTVLAAVLVGTGFVLQQRAAAMEPASAS